MREPWAPARFSSTQDVPRSSLHAQPGTDLTFPALTPQIEQSSLSYHPQSVWHHPERAGRALSPEHIASTSWNFRPFLGVIGALYQIENVKINKMPLLPKNFVSQITEFWEVVLAHFMGTPHVLRAQHFLINILQLHKIL